MKQVLQGGEVSSGVTFISEVKGTLPREKKRYDRSKKSSDSANVQESSNVVVNNVLKVADEASSEKQFSKESEMSKVTEQNAPPAITPKKSIKADIAEYSASSQNETTVK